MTKMAVLTILFVWVTLLSSSRAEFECPSASEILPCTCDAHPPFGGEIVACQGEAVTQESINNLFLSLRSTNNISLPDGSMFINAFEISQTSLTVLNMSALANTQFSGVTIEQNLKLKTIVGTPGDGMLNTTALQIFNCPLNEEAISKIYQFIQPASLQGGIGIEWTEIGGGGGDGGEFFSGFSTFTEIQAIYIYNNPIRNVGGGQFRTKGRLYALVMDNNLIEKIDDDAFLFDQPEADLIDSDLRLSLSGNLLTDAGFSPLSGLQAIGRPLRLELVGNLFEFISAENFQPFLLADDRNELELQYNKFVCDERMKWLKDGRAEFEHRVHGIDCTNDPGHTIFTTELVE